jgi:hypothetical protein
MNITIEGNTISKDGVIIGTYAGADVTLKKDVGPTVKSAIKRAIGMNHINWSVGELRMTATEVKQRVEAMAPAKAETPLATLSDEEIAAELKRRGLLPPPVATAPISAKELQQEAEVRGEWTGVERVNHLQRILDAALRGEIPSPPKCHPQMGDKDPQFVAWAKLHATPEEFEGNYRNRNRKLPSYEQFSEGEAKRKFIKFEKEDNAED